MSWSAPSTRFLNPCTDGDSSTALGSLFQCLTTLSAKKFFLIANLNLPWHNLRPLPRNLLEMGTPNSAPTAAGAEPPTPSFCPSRPTLACSPPFPSSSSSCPKAPTLLCGQGRGDKLEPPTLPACWEPAGQDFHKPSPLCFGIISFFSSAAGSRGVMDEKTDAGRRTTAMWFALSPPVRKEPLRRAILPETPAREHSSAKERWI